MKLTPWTLKQLYTEYLKDIELCQTQHERMLCRTICRKEINKLADKIKKERKLTPGEVSVLRSI